MEEVTSKQRFWQFVGNSVLLIIALVIVISIEHFVFDDQIPSFRVETATTVMTATASETAAPDTAK